MCPSSSITSIFNDDTRASHQSSSDAGTNPDLSGLPSLVPQDSLSRDAYNHAKAHLHPSILAHSLRMFFYARGLSERESNQSHNSTDEESPWHARHRLPLLFTACMFHDFGTTALHDDGAFRFEVEGADAAVLFLQTHGATSQAETHAVWVAIACHTSPHIGERISPLARLIRLGPLMDFHRLSPSVEKVSERPRTVEGKVFVLEDDVKQIERLYPRAEIEKVLGDSVVAQAQRDGRRGKAPKGSWPGDIFRAAEEEPEWEGVSKEF